MSFLNSASEISAPRWMNKRDDVEGLIAECMRAMGAPDILVNNAGIIRRADAVDFSLSDWDELIQVNLTAPFVLAQSAARVMIAGGKRGKIINTASLLSFQGGVRVPAYAASKSAIAGLTRALTNEWAAHGINVNAIAPGYIVTSVTEALREDPARSRDILARIPAGRWGVPEDLAGAAVFLASAASDYVHGTIIPVDDGWLAR
jgi:2-dehydro-3-deoxy-D-gluconate 5-dehydrogenase